MPCSWNKQNKQTNKQKRLLPPSIPFTISLCYRVVFCSSGEKGFGQNARGGDDSDGHSSPGDVRAVLGQRDVGHRSLRGHEARGRKSG